jgi:small GTP-binding protein
MSMWLGRVELALAGADGLLREGQDALAQGDPMRARTAARGILERLPGSPIGLALLADACEAGGLDAELLMTLEELGRRAPSRADVWARLGEARMTLGELAESKDAFMRALAIAEGGSEPRKMALLGLCDLDLLEKDGARAALWLDRLAAPKNPEVAVRNAEACILQQDPTRAMAHLTPIPDDATNGRLALCRGQALAMMRDVTAFSSLIRAYLLDVKGASEALSSALAWIATDEALRERVRTVVTAQGEAETARFRAAFARAEGKRDLARQALGEAVRSGDRSAAEPLFDAAIEDRDLGALALALSSMTQDHAAGRPAKLTQTVTQAQTLLAAASEQAQRARLDQLESVTQARLLPWADALRGDSLAAWFSAPIADWDSVFTRLDELARKLHDVTASARIGELAADRARPVRVAVVGEFNAGKSTFINVVLGADIAPTGVLPTTATLHHLRYARDPIAKIFFHPPEPERLLGLSDLREALKSVDASAVTRVEILVTIPSLLRVEILDTPGFNAPDKAHAEAARRAFEEADLALWLLDASQAMKQSERKILEEAKARGLPVQLLVNKADRLKPEELTKVMTLVTESLTDVGLASWAEPRAFSARRALDAKTKGEPVPPESGWADVELLLDKHIIQKSDELKERGLRRRAALVVSTLADAARAQQQAALASMTRKQERAAAMRLCSAELDHDADTQTQMLTGAVRRDFDRWQAQLAALSLGKDRERAEAEEKDPQIGKYRVDRALAELAPALARVLSRMTVKETRTGGPATAPLLSEADILPSARAVVRGFAARDAGDAKDLPALARAALSLLIEQLAASALAPEEEGEPTVASEVAAFAAALTTAKPA